MENAKQTTVTTENVAELKTTIAALEKQTGGLAGSLVVAIYAVMGLGAVAVALWQDKKILRGQLDRIESEKSAEDLRLAKRTPEERLLDALSGVQKSKSELEAAAREAVAQREADASRKQAIDSILNAHKAGKDISRPESWAERSNGPKAV